MIGQAVAVIAPDTGPLHIASMTSTPAIGLYANSNPERTGPYLWQRYVVNKYPEAVLAATGKSSEKLAWGYRLKDAANMARISVDDVTSMLDQVFIDL